MTIDKAKLKALAEAQAVQVWVRTRGRRPDMKGQPLMYGVEGPEGVSDYEDWGFTGKAADYIATASPATMLALLAEIEEDAMHMRAFGEVMRSQAEQIDQLKAENEDYKSGQERYEQIIEDLKAENEALRKDAARWAFFKDLSCQIQAFPHSWGQMTPEKMDFMCDDAMAKETNHG